MVQGSIGSADCEAVAILVVLLAGLQQEGTNFFVDAMCIPKNAKQKEIAIEYINFMLSEEAGVANAEYTYYASPNSLVYNNATYLEDMGEDVMFVLYPELGNFAEQYNKMAFRNLESDMLDYLNTLWENVKIN